MPNQESIENFAKKVLLKNYMATGGRYICPAWPHYPWQWGWDSCFHAIACAHLGMDNLAKNEIEKLLSVQIRKGNRKGFIPHQIYWSRIIPWRKRGFLDIERLLYKGWMPKRSSLVSQPVLAQAVRAIGDKNFFVKHAQQIVDFYKYFQNTRDPDNDGLISIITPRESGRDSSPEFDFFRFGGLRAVKKIKTLDIANDIAALLWMEFRYKLMGWDEKKVIDSKIFDVQDLAEQCIYIDGLYDLQWMLKEWVGDFSMYTDIDADIKKCEKAVLEKCWDSSTKNFYSLRNGQEHLKTLTIANLFPILIKNLDQDKVNAIVSALEDKKKFNTPYPVPSVAVDEFTFDPDSIAPIWRGPTWMNTNWFLIRGLTRNGVYDTAQKIIHKSVEMVQENGFMEFYHPYTGKGMRTKNFGWSTLAITFSGYYEH